MILTANAHVREETKITARYLRDASDDTVIVAITNDLSIFLNRADTERFRDVLSAFLAEADTALQIDLTEAEGALQRDEEAIGAQ